MRTPIKTLAVILASFLMIAGSDPTDGQIKELDNALEGYFAVPAETIAALRDAGITNDDLPVVLLMAREGKTSPERIGELRARGETWSQIAAGRSIGVSIFYFMVSGEIGSKVYGPIFAKFKQPPPGGLDQVELTDEEIVNMVNLRFVSSYHDYSVFKVMALRDNGKEFARINADVKQIKDEMIKEEKRKRKEEAKAKDTE